MSEPEQRATTRRRLLEVVATIAAVALLVAGMRSFLGGGGEGRDLRPWGDDAPTVEINEMQLNQLRALGYGVQ
jgi:hypothetical protein